MDVWSLWLISRPTNVTSHAALSILFLARFQVIVGLGTPGTLCYVFFSQLVFLYDMKNFDISCEFPLHNFYGFCERTRSAVGYRQIQHDVGIYVKSNGVFFSPPAGPPHWMGTLVRHRRVVASGNTGRFALTAPSLLIQFQVMSAADEMHLDSYMVCI